MNDIIGNHLPETQGRTVRSVVQRQVITCHPTCSLQEATQLMLDQHCSSILVVEDDQPVGIWTEADSLKLDYSESDHSAIQIRHLMSQPLHQINIDASLDEATVSFRQLGVRHLIVTRNDGHWCGIISQSDVVIHQDIEYFLKMNEVGSVLPADQPPMLDQDCSLPDAIRLMRNAKSCCVLISENGEPAGMLTERDVVRLIARRQVDKPLTEVMSKPLIRVSDTMSLLAARSLMEKRNIRHLCVTDQQHKLRGVISFADVLANIEHAYVNRLRSALNERLADLQQSETSLHMANALIDASMDGIMVTDDKGVILSVNPAFTILTGYSEREALGKTPGLLNSGKQGPDFYQQMWATLTQTGCWKGEIWNRRKNGEIYPEWLTITAIHDVRNNRKLYAAIFSDITERKKSEAIIENLAYYDPLTKLPNRQLLFDRIDVALATSHREHQKLALLFVDLDLFKRINDTLGHSAGDEVLCEVADRLRACVREGDTVARVGGDELVILMSEMEHTDSIHRTVQRIFNTLSRSIYVAGQELYITASIGCSIYPEDGVDRDTLLRHADTAMYRAKSLGRNSFQLYSADMNLESKQRLSLENRLHTALSNNEFFLEYQPKQDMSTGQLVGVEALIRWRDREMGIVPPDQFIPAAEELGLIGDIGAWVLQEACRQSHHWQESSNTPLTVSVNVSPQQFQRRDLIADVRQALQQSGADPKRLDLEITESCAVTQVEAVIDALSQLRAQGISISMDDFGTGFSSLSMLSRLPLDNLKIDRSFVSGIPERSKDQELVSTIVLMAHNLGLKTVAEGVETDAQCDYLRQIHCDQGQGYYFNKPLSAEQVSALL